MKPIIKLSPSCEGTSQKCKNKSKIKKNISKTADKLIKRTLSSKKKPKKLGEFFTSEIEKKLYSLKSHPSLKKSRKCLFKEATTSRKTINKNAQRSCAFVDETSSSSFTFSSNPHQYIDVDIAGHSNRLDITIPLEVVADNNPLFNPSPSKKSEKQHESENQSRGKKIKPEDSSSKVLSSIIYSSIHPSLIHSPINNLFIHTLNHS